MAAGPEDLLLHGPDIGRRTAALQALRQTLFSSPDQELVDSDTLDAPGLSAEALGPALLSMPALASRRLVRVLRAEKLEKKAAEALTAFLRAPHPQVVVVLESDTWDEGAKWRQALGALCRKVGSAAPEGPSVFDLMRSVGAGNGTAALRTLKTLYDNGEEPERLLGGMLWAWSNKMKGVLPAPAQKKGLLLMQEADMALKRSRYPDRENALEVLVVKLSSLAR